MSAPAAATTEGPSMPRGRPRMSIAGMKASLQPALTVRVVPIAGFGAMARAAKMQNALFGRGCLGR